MWGIVTFLLTFALMRASVSLLFVFSIITITFFLLGAGKFCLVTHPDIGRNLTRAGGGFGIVGGFAAMYTAMAGLLTPDTSFFTIPVGNLAPQ
jgi:succinate-acetate transporter protein